MRERATISLKDRIRYNIFEIIVIIIYFSVSRLLILYLIFHDA